MATNDFLTIAGGGGAFVETQATFAADSSVLANGFPAGILTKEKLNKAIRQSSIMSTVLAQFIADTSGVNSVDDGTTATLLANLKKYAQMALSGSALNLVMNIAAASASATLTADAIVVSTTLGGILTKLVSFSKTINLATTGAGGMDTGSAPASGFVALYAIYNPATATAALLAVNATAAAAPAIYGGANMPSGYTQSGLISVWPTDGSGNMMIGYQTDKNIFIMPIYVLTDGGAHASPTSVSIAGAVPKNAKKISGSFLVKNLTGVSNMNGWVGGSINTGTDPRISLIGGKWAGTRTDATGYGINSQYSDIPIITAQTIYYLSDNSAGTMSFNILVSGYTI